MRGPVFDHCVTLGRVEYSIAYQVGGDVSLNRYSASGSLLGGATLTTTPAYESHPRAAMDDRGNTVVVWQAASSKDSVYARTVNKGGKLGAVVTIGKGSYEIYNPYGENWQG